MRWLLKNPAPTDSRMKKWGDYHFGRSLAKYLERLGHEVVTQYEPHWREDTACDVVLVLRGRYPFPPGLHAGATRVMWNISHPADVPLDEYESYDMVFVGSTRWAEELATRVTVPVAPLLQCTDLEEFTAPADSPRRDFVFVGNTRGIERPGVLWALEYGLPLRIWGRGWSDWGAADHVVKDYHPNEELGALYARSRVTLNDHYDDMKEYGFVNNRIFDALACNLPVVSDWNDELHDLFPTGVLHYRDRDEFEACIEAVLLRYPDVAAATVAAGDVVRRDFSFAARAETLSTAVAGHRSG